MGIFNLSESSFQVVGIGASAGGLEAITLLVNYLPNDLNYAFIVAQHISPNFRSMMVDILSRETQLSVMEARDKQTPLPNTIYIIPPGFNLRLTEIGFELLKSPPEISPKPSINILFQSLAELCGDQAIGIVLSGTGSDGTSGLRAIKAAGGMTLVQAPETAKYDAMPLSAIDAGVVDRILIPQEMGKELQRLLNFSDVETIIKENEYEPDQLQLLFYKVREQTKIDFSSYKLATVLRRLHRRLVATETHSLSKYLHFVDESPDELAVLAKETLISVTDFFRDKDSFAALDRQVKEIVAFKKANEEIRVWSVGCATGEEAYSLGILILERLEDLPLDSNVRVQIFATDLDNEALSIARRGIYKRTALESLPADYITKYFRPTTNGFEPIKALRDCIIFAKQNIISDTPFLRLDLITCRNVLIYFNTDLQSRVMNTFHYALNANGVLFLGRSENINQHEDLFLTIDRRNRIFTKQGESQKVNLNQSNRNTLSTLFPLKKKKASYEQQFMAAVGDFYAPVGLLINENFTILHAHGKVQQFLNFPASSDDMNLAELLVPEFRNEILTCFHRARKQQESIRSRKRRIASLEGKTWRLALHPVLNNHENSLYLVAFEECGTEKLEKDLLKLTQLAEIQDDNNAQDELIAAREHLQTLLEEMAASNEEMQALNEEVHASNEELQASNEELEAANEELQASNEELISVNEESLAKSSELLALNAEFESLYNSIDFPILVFDSALFFKRANLIAIRNYDLPLSGNNRHVSRLSLPPYLKDIEHHLLNVLNEQSKKQFYIRHEANSYQVLITPSLNSLGLTHSVVLVVIDNTELVAAQALVAESQSRLLSVMNHSTLLISLKDTAGRYEFANHRFEAVFGVKLAEINGKTDYQIFPELLAKKLRRQDFPAMEQLEMVTSVDEFNLAGNKLTLELTHFPIFDHKGVVLSTCMQAIDVTQKYRAEAQLRLAAKVFDSAGEAIMITDAEAHIIKVNNAFSKITGYSLEQVIGKKPNIFDTNEQQSVLNQEMRSALAGPGIWQGELNNRRADGSSYPEWLTISALQDASGDVSNYVAIFSDISAIKMTQSRVEYLATHDELTGLANRAVLMDRMKHSIAQAHRSDQLVVVMFIDLDNFKNINDVLGHDAGDLLLKQASERLLNCVRDSDTLVRLGGDEFVAILEHVQLDEINYIASRVIDFMSASFRINDRDCFVSASIGISVFPQDGEDSITLLKNADTAMYRSKEKGRNQYHFFAEEMKLKAMQRLTLETGLRLALDSQQLYMQYQPKIDMHDSDKIMGAEALLRWSSPDMGLISPAQFILVAENCGLMNGIGEYVLDKVINQIATWKQENLVVPVIAINLSVKQLRDDRLYDILVEKLAKYQVAPENIILEITESAIMENIEIANTVLKRLADFGVKVSVDDFGTGYSSLLYLKRLPISELKVDRSFVDGIDSDAEDNAITHAIITMAHALNLKVVAEGVENNAQLNVLRDLNCDIAQGYYYHRPLDAHKFAELLRSKQTESGAKQGME